MSLHRLPEPPTDSTLKAAREDLLEHRKSLASIAEKIAAAEAALAQILRESRCAIDELQRERNIIEEKVYRTEAYVAPIRRLPQELLRHIFMLNFETNSSVAWIISAVCRLWRRLALSMPRMWSKIRLVTTPHSSADIVRLWLERSGDIVPLDIEIYLHITSSDSPSRPRRASSTSPAATWIAPLVSATPHHAVQHGVTFQLNPHSPMVISASPPWDAPTPPPPSLGPPPGERPTQTRASMHWGHVAIFYLVEQMHRWERFVFKFDKQFTTMSALKSIMGDAPMLKELEVSCSESAFYNDWPWLPSASATSTVALPQLTSLTLQYTPFKWTSPVFHAGLRSLTLKALPTSHLPLDRIMHIVASNPMLESLSLTFSGVLAAVLPLTLTALQELKDLSLSGHFMMTLLADSLVVPSLDSLSLNIEARDPIEDTIQNLLARSNNPPLRTLAVAYGSNSAPSFYYGPGGAVISWAFLSDLTSLESLQVGGTPFEPLLTALGPPEDNDGVWACPNLVSLAMRSCHAHGDGVGKLVQMIDARNPDSQGGNGAAAAAGVVKLKQLELYECASVGADVTAWLQGRVEEVTCLEPAFERSPLLGYHHG